MAPSRLSVKEALSSSRFHRREMRRREPTECPLSHTAKTVVEPGLELRPWDSGARGPILLGTLAGDTLARDTRQGRGASRVLLRVTSF